MRVQPVTPISPARLGRIRWRAKRAYRLLSYSLSFLSNRELLAKRIDEVFGGFAVEPGGAGNGDVYRLLDLGPGKPRRYRLFRGDEQLLGTLTPGDAVHQLMWRAMLGMVEQTKDFLLIHAGAVVSPGGKGVLLPGDAGSGKTTLVTGLVRAGFGFLSDEVGVIQPGNAQMHPFPRALNLKDGSLALFPDLRPQDDGAPVRGRRGFVMAEKVRPDSEVGPSEVGFVIAPRYRKDATTEVTELSPAEVAKELWANAMNQPAHGTRALQILADVAKRAKGYRLVSGNLEEALQAVVGVTRLSPRPSDGSGRGN